MPNSILHKRSSTAGVVPHAALLANGEIALNSADGTWFIKKTDGTVLDLRQPLITDGGAQPLAGINADAQDWQTRVIAAGGTVSASTFTAVNNFCNAITSAGLRDRFYRLNLFCGDNLAACLVPLYRGPSLTGTQFGNTTDTNVNNNFVAGDYVETGVTGGLKGNGSNKALRTGLLPADMGGPLHLSVALMSDVAVNQAAIGADNFQDVGWTSASIDFAVVVTLRPRSALSSSVGVNFTETISSATSCRLVSTSSRSSGATQRAYFNGALSATNSPTYQTQPAFDFAVFGSNRKNTSIVSHTTARLSSYSIGVDMTDAQVSAFDAAVRAFQVALNRTPPTVSNADAQDWVNRVYAAGGTVSATTAAAVNTFCSTIDAAGIRDRFYRLNLFCGNNLTACLVPLYRGPSLGGTQLGNATDTNNSFVSGDYVETGTTGGLIGAASSKWLNTGFRTQDLPGVNDTHIAVWSRAADVTETRRAIGCFGPTGDSYLIDRRLTVGGGTSARIGGPANFAAGIADASEQSMIASRTSATLATLYKNGVAIASQTTTLSGVTLSTTPFGVFSADGTVGGGFFPHRLNGYSIGAGLSQSQVTAFHNAWAVFQNALTRTIPFVSNADAQDWVNRVYAAGGTVSQSTADAVNTFCNTINSTGLRDRFYRLNLFCGNDLTACRVPLYRGPSLGGTQFGNVTDTNNNFTASDYNERGTTGGLIGNGTSKHLDTGLATSAWPVISSFHASAFVFGATTQSGPEQAAPIAVRVNTAPANRWGFDFRRVNTLISVDAGGTLNGLLPIPVNPTYQHVLVARRSVTDVQGFVNGFSGFTDGTDISTALAASNLPFFVFAQNQDGTAARWFAWRMGGYSLGAGMTAAQALVYNNAVQAFQTALNRAV